MTKICCVLVIVVFQLNCGYPSDSELERVFSENRTDFTRLTEMLTEDKHVVVLNRERIYYSEDDFKPISANRLAHYSQLLEKLGLESIHRENDRSINLIAMHRGMLFHTSGKGYYYSTAGVTPIVPSLDSVIRNDRGDTPPTFMKIGDNWYLVFESW